MRLVIGAGNHGTGSHRQFPAVYLLQNIHGGHADNLYALQIVCFFPDRRRLTRKAASHKRAISDIGNPRKKPDIFLDCGNTRDHRRVFPNRHRGVIGKIRLQVPVCHMHGAVQRSVKPLPVVLAEPNGQHAEHGEKKDGKGDGKGQEAPPFQS